MSKKLMAVLLALALCLSLLPMTAFASTACSCGAEGCECEDCEEGSCECGCDECAAPSGQDCECGDDGECTCGEGECECGDGCECSDDADCHPAPGPTPGPTPTPTPTPTPAPECTGLASCPADVHDAGCKAACNKGGCNLSKGHEGNHNGTGCSNDEYCPVTTGHELTCPVACGKGGCTLSAGHESTHNGSECSNDEYCNAEMHVSTCTLAQECENKAEGECGLNIIGASHSKTCIANCTGGLDCTNTDNHKDDCLKKALDEANEGVDENAVPHMLSATEENVPIILICDCDHTTDGEHLLATGSNQCGADVKTIYVDVEYVYATGEDNEGWSYYDESTLAAEKQAALDHYTDVVTAAENDAEEVYCDECKEALQESGDLCTGDATCQLPADTAEERALHEANCPQLCTMGTDCPNEAGNASAHKVEFVLYRNNVEVDRYPTASAANDELTRLVALDKNHDYTYVVRADGCPLASVVADVEVVGDEDEAEAEETEEPSTPDVITKAEDFSDVDADSWFAEDLNTLLEKGWLTGGTDGSFGADESTTGEMVVVILSRVLDLGLVTTGTDWAAEATAWAADEGITEGIEITNGEIARKDLILMLWRVAGKPESDYELSFEDADGLDGEHLAAMKWAVENGIVTGYAEDNTIKPDGATSRAEMTTLIVRFGEVIGK